MGHVFASGLWEGVLRILVYVEIVLIVGMKEFGKFMWRDNKKELISIFGYVRKVPCKCMKSAMRRRETHVQEAKFSVEILSTLENA